MGYRKEIVNTATLMEETVLDSEKSVATEISGVEYIVYYITLGGATSDVISMDFETSPDGVDWYPLSTLADDTSATTVYNRLFTYTMSGATNKVQVPLNVQDKFIRINISSGNTSGTAEIKVTKTS